MILIPQYRTARRASAAAVVTLAYLQSTSSTTNSASYTFAAQNIGTATPGRHIIVAVSARAGTPAAATSVTIGGVTASLIEQTNGQGHAIIAIAAVPSGTTADVVVTLAGTYARCAIGMWSADNIDATPFDTTSSTSTSPSATIDVEAGGIIIATANAQTASAVTWTAPAEDYEVYVETNMTATGAGAFYASADTGKSIGCNIGGTGPVFIAASWGPA